MKFFCNFKKATYIAKEKEIHLNPVRLYSYNLSVDRKFMSHKISN